MPNMATRFTSFPLDVLIDCRPADGSSAFRFGFKVGVSRPFHSRDAGVADMSDSAGGGAL